MVLSLDGERCIWKSVGVGKVGGHGHVSPKTWAQRHGLRCPGLRTVLFSHAKAFVLGCMT